MKKPQHSNSEWGPKIVFCGTKLHLRIPYSLFKAWDSSWAFCWDTTGTFRFTNVWSWVKPSATLLMIAWMRLFACAVSCLHDLKLKTSGKILISQLYQFVILHAALINLFDNHLIITALRRLFSCMRGFLGCVKYWTGQLKKEINQ